MLPPNSWHVLQPLSLSIFGPACRCELEKLFLLNDLTLIQKVAFLKIYHKTRKVGFTESKILSAWESTGLWPVNVEKPLANPMVTPSLEEDDDDVFPQTPLKKTFDFSSEIIETPNSSAEIWRSLKLNFDISVIEPKMCLYLEKIGNMLDLQNALLAEKELKIKDLEHTYNQKYETSPKKVPKVVLKLN